jgi:elongation factor G
MAFEIAGSLALQEALEKGGSAILEPIMRIEIVSPEQFMGDVIGDLNSRRGHVESTESKTGTVIGARLRAPGLTCSATPPTALHDPGTRIFLVRVDHYQEVPQSVATSCWRKLRRKTRRYNYIVVCW